MVTHFYSEVPELLVDLSLGQLTLTHTSSSPSPLPDLSLLFTHIPHEGLQELPLSYSQQFADPRNGIATLRDSRFFLNEVYVMQQYHSPEDINHSVKLLHSGPYARIHPGTLPVHHRNLIIKHRSY